MQIQMRVVLPAVVPAEDEGAGDAGGDIAKARSDLPATFSVPEVDDEVLVAFAQGDMRGMFAHGALWNAGDKPPDAAR